MADEQPQLHDLTKLLLDRMKTYPEELFDNVGHPAPYKWRHALQSVENYGRPEDRQALHDAYMDHALQAALKVLLVLEEKKDDFTTDDVRYKTTLRMPLLDESFTRATKDIATQSYILIREDGTTYRVPQERVEDDPDLVAAIRELMRR